MTHPPEMPSQLRSPKQRLSFAFDAGRWTWSATLGRSIGVAFAFWFLAPKIFPGLPLLSEGQFALALFAAMVAARWVAGIPSGVERARLATSSGACWWQAAPQIVVPAELVGFLRLSWLTATGCVSWILRRRPSQIRPVGTTLTDRRKGFYDGLFYLNTISFAVEVPVMLMLMGSMRLPLVVHWTAHLVEILAIGAILGDRWHVLSGGHVLTSSHLDLMAGVRASAKVPLDAIETIQRMDKKDGGPWAWRRARHLRASETAILSVLDTPNVAITLRPDARLIWSRWQVTLPLPRYLLLYVDDPGTLELAVATPCVSAVSV